MCFASYETRRSGSRLIMVLAIAALAAGCAQKRDSVVVGAIPDDYRTNHPIVIAEKQETLDLPVARSDRSATRSQRVALEGFLAHYDRSAAAPLTIMKPVGSANAIAADAVAKDFAQIARRAGVPAHRIMYASYQASPDEASAPLRVTYTAMRAQTGQCGRWPEDVLQTSENKHYANFGCSYQNNIAAQIANPADLLGPRKPAPIDADNRGKVIADYQAGNSGFTTNTDY